MARAVRAGPAWRSVSPADRARLLRRFAAAVEDHGEELARLETANVGKPVTESRDDVAMVAEVCISMPAPSTSTAAPLFPCRAGWP